MIRISTSTFDKIELSPKVAQTADWLVSSGVQVVSDNPLHKQGFVSWYEADTQTMPYVYSEITGYMVTMMGHLYDTTGDIRFLDSARGAADWLLRTAHPETGGFRCLFPLTSTRFDYKYDQIYVFDTGVIVSGLVNIYRATGEVRYLDAATKASNWMICDMQKRDETAVKQGNWMLRDTSYVDQTKGWNLQDIQSTDGAFYPVYDLRTGTIVESSTEWSLSAGSYHSKVAMGLINLYDVTQNEVYREAAIRACDFALSFQQSDGRFVSFPIEGGTNSHPHAYSAEGLWVVGSILQREEYLQASVRATQWLLDWQSEEGYVPRHFHNGEPLYNERVDILSQTLRLASIHLAEGRLPSTPEIITKLNKLVSVISRNQAQSNDRRINGGFYFGRLSNGETMPHVNVWVSSFAIQGLGLYEAFLNNTYQFNPFFMV